MATASQASKPNGKSPRAEVMEIEEQLEKLSEDVKTLSGIIADIGTDKVNGVRKQASEVASEMKARSLETFDKASKHAIAAENDFEDRIRANPLAAIGIAAGIGFLLAKVTKN